MKTRVQFLNPCKRARHGGTWLSSLCWGGGDQWIPRTCWLASRPHLLSKLQVSKRPILALDEGFQAVNDSREGDEPPDRLSNGQP